MTNINKGVSTRYQCANDRLVRYLSQPRFHLLPIDLISLAFSKGGRCILNVSSIEDND